MTTLRTMAAAVVFASCAAQPALAQAICSAPHSSPTLTRAGIGTLAPGTGWLQATAYYARSDAFFGPDGESRSFLADGEATTTSAFVTAAAGVVSGVELWLQVPVHRLRFEDEGGARTRVGIGDPRVSLRVAAAALGAPQLPLSLRLGAKFPGTDFPVDPDILPLTEGQTDLEMALEGGRLLTGVPLHIAGFVGYRWRLEDRDRQRKPGDELFARLGGGGRVGAAHWELAVEGLTGGDLEQQGLRLPTARRRLVQLLPTIGWSRGTWQMEFTGRFNLAGRNLPSGPSFSAGVLVPWSF